MKAAFIRRYGGPEVVEFADIETPKPEPGEVLVRVRASSVNPIDWKIVTGALKLFVRHPFPIVLGVDVAGEVSAIGDGVQHLAVGDEVFAMTPNDLSGNAEFVVLPETVVVKKPPKLTFEEAASVPAVALTALQALRDLGHVHEGQEVLVNGASGGVGMFAVQLAKVFGARVTAVASARNGDFVRGLGADRFVDYQSTDFTTLSDHYPVIFDCVGKRSFSECKKVLHDRGTFVSTESTPGLFLDVALSALSSRKAKAIIVKSRGEDLAFIRTLLKEGRLRTCIDRTYPLSQIAEAHAYSKTGRARGKIALAVH
jgi:NADPH:quinone reductase-like Zn-dependent oxidoreductase